MERTYRSDSKQVIEKVRSHIYDYYNLDDLKNDIEAIKLPYDNIYSAAKKLVKGGSFLVYHTDVRKFLESLHLNNKSRKDFSDTECWEMYVHLLAREISNIIKKEVKNEILCKL